MPDNNLGDKFITIKKENIKYRMFNFYHRIGNPIFRKYTLKEAKVNVPEKSKWVPKIKKIKSYKKENIDWARMVFQPYRWRLDKRTNPPVYRKIYTAIKRLEDRIYVNKPNNIKQRSIIRFELSCRRNYYKNNLKIARNLGKQLFF